MKITGQHILAALAAIVILFASCNRDEAEVIPRKKLAKIYAEMLVTDQWIISTPGIRKIADTSLVYEPILENYGYDSEDYRKSIDFYMNDPERFSRIFRTTGEILDSKLAELRKEQARLIAMSKLPKVRIEFDMGEFVPYLDGEPYVHYYDSLDVVMDSATRMYRLSSIERGDTLYDRIRMIIVDSLSVADSLALADSLAVADSLVVADSLKKIVIADSLKPESLSPKMPKAKFRSVKLDSLNKIR